MEALQALIRKKDALEAEAESLTEQLSASNMGGVSGPLVDREGFPRADVDVHATRLLRNRLACLNTDHRELMGQIEQSMHALHAAAAADGCLPNPSLEHCYQQWCCGSQGLGNGNLVTKAVRAR